MNQERIFFITNDFPKITNSLFSVEIRASLRHRIFEDCNRVNFPQELKIIDCEILEISSQWKLFQIFLLE